MPPLDKRVERNTGSILSLRDLLTDVARNPAAHQSDRHLVDALRSQGALAKLGRPELGIHSCSLNTQKRLAEDAIEGGYASLDTLRHNALRAITSPDTPPPASEGRRNKADYVARVAALEQEVQLLLEDMLILQQAFDRRSVQARHYAEATKNPALIEKCIAEQREVEAALSLRNRPLPSGNVVALRK